MSFILLTEMIGVPTENDSDNSRLRKVWGVFTFVLLLLQAAARKILGPTAAYLIVYYLGRPAILRHSRFARITEERLSTAKIKFGHHRRAIILISNL